ncbi:MAG: RNA polymerase sigma factor [Myxococcota bacterium]
MPSDEELMKRVAEGDGEALAALVERHSARVHAYLTRYTRSREDADDLLQETWIRVARSARRFDPARRFRTWLYGIATNLGRDLFRRRGTRERALLDINAQPEPSTSNEASIAERREVRDRIAGLPDRMREVVLLRYFEGMNEAEMAAALGIARGTVKSRLHTALGRLREGYGVTG